MSSSTSRACQLLALVVALASVARARSLQSEAPVSAVLPSPNQEFGDELFSGDIQRMSSAAATPAVARIKSGTHQPMASIEPPEQAEPSNEASAPVYVSPFKRAERGATLATPLAPSSYEQRQESSQAPPNYAPIPSASAASDLKTSASYGHHHHGGQHYGYDHSGWLDMGAWTGGKGSFGWYADYPVGGKQHGYGRK